MDEKVKILVNCSIRKMDRIVMRRKPYAARLQERWRHAVSKFRVPEFLTFKRSDQ